MKIASSIANVESQDVWQDKYFIDAYRSDWKSIWKKKILNFSRGVLTKVCLIGNSLTSALHTSRYSCTVRLSETELWRLWLLVLGGIIENQNSDFVMQ